MVLASQFESLKHPFTIMVSLPLALVGARLALPITGKNQSLGAMIGIILLMGLVTKTFAMAIGMVPTAIGSGVGSEFRSPMAIAVIGGVITSTALTLLVVPVVFSGVERMRLASLRAFLARMFSSPAPLTTERPATDAVAEISNG
jgi:HAE1 family hydrophobic/amphiphilic exporter-1